MISRAQSIIEKYDALVAQGALERDASQRAAIEKLSTWDRMRSRKLSPESAKPAAMPSSAVTSA